MINYGLPIEQQKFKYTDLPHQYKLWKNGSREKSEFVDKMYHIRDNGQWQIIKGQPVYITGGAWFFFNWWTLQEGGRPDFRIEAVEFYQVEDWIYRSPYIMGMLLFKMRQEGASAKINCAMYNRITRASFAKGGIMGNDEHRAKANIAKIQIAQNKMVDFFKPITKGSNKDVTSINFTLPETRASNKKLRDGEFVEHLGLESEIFINASVLGAFDGDRLHQMYFDEFGKVFKFNVYEQLKKMKPFLISQKGDGSFSGKVFYGSTVEDSQDIKAEHISYILGNLTKLYEDSDPNKVDSKGRTKSGLVRYLKDCISATQLIDEYGFPKREEAIAEYEELMTSYEADKDWKAIAQHKKQYPRTIKDALSGNSLSCILFPHLLDQKIATIRLGHNHLGEEQKPLAIQGDLVWTDSTWTACKWISSPNGKWWISQHPTEPNAKTLKGNKRAPKNGRQYKLGADPTDTLDAVSHSSQLSKTGIVVKRALDKSAESNDVEFYEVEGIEKCRNPHKMQTNRVVCTYHNRNDDPLDNFIDVLKTAVYFGCPALIESNSPYTYNRMREEFPTYLANKPDDAKTDAQIKRAKRNPNAFAAMRTTVTDKRTYNDVTISYVHDYWTAIEHINLLEDFRNFNGSNHTDCDLMVAFALAEIQDQNSRILSKKNDEVSKEWKTNVLLGVPDY